MVFFWIVFYNSYPFPLPPVFFTIFISGKFSLKTDAVVRSVTVVFKLGEQIDDETTVG